MQRAASIACFFICINCFAQQYPFVQYTPREGLVNNRAKFIFQDSKGRLYIATYGGLSIYDGTRFTNYTTNNGLSVDLINDIVEMGDDSIWVISNDNYLHYIVKGELKNFKSADNFIPLINQLIKCSDGYYYAMADEGFFRLEDRRFVKIVLNGFKDSVRTLMQAVEIGKKLYILFNPDYKLPGSNLLVYDLTLNKLVCLDKTIYASHLYHSPGNGLFISTTKGLFIVDTLLQPNKPIGLKPIPDSFHLPKNLFPYSIYQDRQNSAWFFSSKGVYRVKKNGDTTLFSVGNGLTTNFQNSIFEDHENNIWFTNEQTGLSKLSNQQFTYYPILKSGLTPTELFIPSFSDSIWIYDGYHHHVLLILPNGQTRDWVYPNESLPYASSFISANGEWLSNGYNIYRWKASQNSGRYSLSLFYRDSINPMGFNNVAKDRYGNLVAVSNKLVVIAGNKILSEPLNYMTDQVTVDRNNRIWAATRSNQLFCFEISGTGNDMKLSKLKSFIKIQPGSPRSIAADQSGNIWIGTRDQGLYCLHFDGVNLKSTKQLTTVNGLSENFVRYLFCDNENNIWACTPSGLDKIKLDNDHFSVENITKSNNFYIPILKIQQTAKGLFWILTSEGVITYNPYRPAVEWEPTLVLSNFMIGKTGHVSIPASGKLSHDQNNLSFQLSAPTFIDEKQTRFSYLLEGSGNKNWSTPSTDAAINFVNLPAGRYTLKAKAIFLHGLYPTVESSYSFTILPPWWLTWWFKLLMGTLILALLLSGIRFYINRKLQSQRVMLEKRRAIEQERTRIATDMHDDLGAGLSQIKFLSETIGMRKQKHLPIEEEIDSIRTFSHEMIDKMGEIVWALNEKNDTLSDLLSYTRSYAVEYLEQNGIGCKVNEPDILPQDYVSSEFRRNIYLTVKETLHNVVKHAQATEVVINIDITHLLSMKIKDNGKGFDDRSIRPLGNGLINMNARIKGLGGKFEILNNNGTEVNIVVPLDT